MKVQAQMGNSSTTCIDSIYMMPRYGYSFLCLLLIASLSSGCAGYQLGSRSLYRPDIQTVYVPMIESDSLRRHLGERLTEAVVKQIELKTPFKVVSTPLADSTLSGRIVVERKQVLTENTNDEPRHIETIFQVQMTWVDRSGNLIAENMDVPLPPWAVTISQTSSFIPEGGQSIATSHQESIQQLAVQIVAQMEMPW